MPPNTLAARLQSALDRKPGATKAALARACQVKGPSVVDWFNGKTLSLKGRSLVRAAAYLGVDPGWLATGSGSPGWTDIQHSVAGEPPPRWEVAQVLSLPPINSPLITWGENMHKDLPRKFRVAAPDDSMAPRVRAGELLEFDTSLQPRAGDGVLVRDDAGHHFFRIYRERRPGHWEAAALNPAFQGLDSERDGLHVLAVMTAVFQRWG